MTVPHPKEMEYIIQHTGAKGTALEKLAFDPPSKEADEAWFSLLKRSSNHRLPIYLIQLRAFLITYLRTPKNVAVDI